MRLSGMFSPYGNRIEQAKAHGPCWFSMVTWRPHGTKGIVGFAGDHSVHSVDQGTCGTQSSFSRARGNNGVRIQMPLPLLWNRSKHLFNMICRVHEFQSVSCRPGGFMMLQTVERTCLHGPANRAQTINAFRVPGTGIVVQTGIVGVEAGGHGC